MVSETKKIINDLQELIDAMNNERLIIFVGAGISQNSGMPGWNELMEPLKKELGFDESERDYLKIAQCYYDNHKDTYKNKIKEIFGDLKSFKPNPLHELIEIIEPEHVITTNYDNLLEMQLNSKEEKYSVIAADTDIPQGKSKHQIIKMHGDFIHDNIVLKENDYTRYSKNFPSVSKLIETRLMNHTVLFIGYSLNDSTFKALLDNILETFGDSARKHYYFTPTAPLPAEIMYYAHKGIELLSGNLKISNKDKDKNKKMEEAIAKFLANLVENKPNASQLTEPINLIKSVDVQNSKDIWDNINFLNILNYVETRDVFRYANISDQALLYPSNQVIYQNNKGNKINIDNKNLIDFLQTKTWISSFLGAEINRKNGIEINPTLEAAFDLYKQKQYSDAFNEFDKISSSALEAKDYWNYFIAEFNLSHIVTTYGNGMRRTKAFNLDEVISNVLSNGNLNEKRIANFFKEEIQSFRFIYKKLFRINDLLDNFKKEHVTYKNGGYSSNNNLWTAYYEVNSLMTFIDANCITVYQYKEFKNIINRYFECLLISYDNKNYQNSQDDFFRSTSSIINEFQKDDVKLIVQHIDFKNMSTIMNNYDLDKILISTESQKYLYGTISVLKDELLTTSSFEKLNEIESCINFLSLTSNVESNQIIDILNNYPITQINSAIIRKLLVLLLNNTESIDKKSAIKLYPIINQHLHRIILNKYLDTHSRNFYMYRILLERIKKVLSNDIFKFSEQQIISIFSEMSIEKKSLLELPKYSTYIINFYQFFNSELKNTLIDVLKKYEKLGKEEFNIYFEKEILLNGIYSFPLKRKEVLLSWVKAISAPENASMKTFPDPKIEAINQVFFALDNEYFTKSEIQEFVDINTMKGYIPEIDWKFFKVHTKETIEKILKNTTFSQARKTYSNSVAEEKLWDEWILEQAHAGQVKFTNKLLK